MSDDHEIAAIERAAFLAWPAAEIRAWGGWRLRATPGVSRRANSVWLGPGSGLPLGSSVAEVEAFYRARRLRPMFQIAPSPESDALDAYLHDRGYQLDTPVAVRSADAEEVLSSPAAVLAPRGGATSTAASSVEISATLPAAWFAISAHQGHYREVASTYQALLERIGPQSRFALARDGGEPAAVGLLVLGQAWSGIFSMQTLGSHRRRGLGAAVLVALAKEAHANGARQLYLQVERGNEAAERLYTACGFRERYGYHYRLGPLPTVP